MSIVRLVIRQPEVPQTLIHEFFELISLRIERGFQPSPTLLVSTFDHLFSLISLFVLLHWRWRHISRSHCVLRPSLII